MAPRLKPYLDGDTFVFWVETKPVGYKRDVAVLPALGRKAGARGGLSKNENIKAVMDFRNAVSWEFRCSLRETKDRPAWLRDDGSYVGLLEVEIEFYGASDDIVNVAKEVEDALNGVAWHDDCLIKRLSVSHPERRSTGNGGIRKPGKGEEQGLRIAITYLEPGLVNAPSF